MKGFKWFKKKMIRKATAVVTALALTGTTVPAVAQEGGVSGAFLGAAGGYAVQGQASTGNLQLVSYHSGNWKLGQNGGTSPAWKDFSKTARVDMAHILPGDIDGVFSYLSAGGIDREACEKSSVIWVVQDNTYSSPTNTTINIHMDWLGGKLLNGNPGIVKSQLSSALSKNGAKTENLAQISEAVSAHEAVQNQNWKNLKVLCSFQFSNEKEPEEEPVYYECVPTRAGNCEEPPAEGGSSSDEYLANTPTQELCTSSNGRWQSPGEGGSRYAGVDTFANWISGESGDGGLGLSLGISGFTSVWGKNLISLANGGGEFRNVRVAWRCNTRYQVYYQTSPATYSTRTSLAQIESPEKSKIFNNVFTATQDASTGMLSLPTFQPLVTNSDLSRQWYDIMKIAATTSALSRESTRIVTNYGKVWNNTKPLASNGRFDAFYDTAMRIENSVKKDKNNNNNFSSGTGLHLDHLAVLANGGVLNVEERERQKIIRVVQPYVEVQIAKCVTEDFWSAIPINHCNPIPSGSVADYSNEKVNTALTSPTDITIDQARYLINRTANLTRDIASGNGSGIIEGFNRLVRLMDGQPLADIQRCSDGMIAKAKVNGQTLTDIQGIAQSGDLFTAALRIYNTFNNIRTGLNNITLPCQDILERGNPEQSNKIVGDIFDLFSRTSFFNNPYARLFTVAFVPRNATMQVQKAQFDPETVSWWQAISVNCNQSGFEQLVAQTQSDIISDDIAGIGSAFHGVARSPLVRVDESKSETLFTPENYFFGRPGTPSYYTSFYDKECPFNCTSDPGFFGASDANDAVNNTPISGRAELKGYGAQMKDENASNTYLGVDNEFINTDFINIFRDNVEKRIRVDTWYPTNNLGQLASVFDEVSAQLRHGDIISFLSAAEKVADTAYLHEHGGSSFGIAYDGSEPITTTITRFEAGTPTIGDFFRIYAVKGAQGPGINLEAGTGDREEIFRKGTKTEIPGQKSLSQDILKSGTGSEIGAIIPGLVNNIDVASLWASEKSKPQVLNFKWEYQTASVFISISSAGFARKGIEDPDLHQTSQYSQTFTILEGWCYAMFGQNDGKNTIGLMQANTGTGVKNKLDNGNGLVTTSPSSDDPENLTINSLRATTE